MGFVGAAIPTTKKLISMFGVEFDLHNMDLQSTGEIKMHVVTNSKELRIPNIHAR